MASRAWRPGNTVASSEVLCVRQGAWRPGRGGRHAPWRTPRWTPRALADATLLAGHHALDATLFPQTPRQLADATPWTPTLLSRTPRCFPDATPWTPRTFPDSTVRGVRAGAAASGKAAWRPDRHGDCVKRMDATRHAHHECQNISRAPNKSIVTGRHQPHAGLLYTASFKWGRRPQTP